EGAEVGTVVGEVATLVELVDHQRPVAVTHELGDDAPHLVADQHGIVAPHEVDRPLLAHRTSWGVVAAVVVAAVVAAAVVAAAVVEAASSSAVRSATRLAARTSWARRIRQPSMMPSVWAASVPRWTSVTSRSRRW